MLKLFSLLKNADHVIWDWNGTLLSDVSYAVKTVNRLLEPRGLPLLTVESYQKTFCFPIRKYYDLLGFDFKNETFEEVCDIFVDHFMEGIGTCDLVPGARDLLAKVKASGKMQSVLSATDQVSLAYQMKSFELEQHFDNIYGIENKFAAGKVHRGHDLIKATRVPVEKTVLIGDTDHDLEVGNALGVPVILLAHGHQCAQKLRQIHHTVVDVDQLTED